jgi:hypothetical protein
MNYAVEMDSGATIHKPSFIKIGSNILTLLGGGEFTAVQTTRTLHKPTFIF